MKTQLIKISYIKENKTNPRFIKDGKFNKLVKSIKEFPEMLEMRPIVVNENMVVLGGNMRLKACQEAGLKEVYVLRADNLTEEQQKEFIIKDNVGFGEWDWDLLGNTYEFEQLEDWGLDTIKHDWGELDYIEEEVENKNFEEDNQILISLSEEDVSNKRKIKDDLATWLEQNYKGCEIK